MLINSYKEYHWLSKQMKLMDKRLQMMIMRIENLLGDISDDFSGFVVKESNADIQCSQSSTQRGIVRGCGGL